MNAARGRFWHHRFEASAPIITAAIERGELPAHVDPREVLETLSSPLYFRLLVGEEPIDDAFIARCVDNTLALHGRP